MYIRPLPFFPLPSGAAAHNALVYIGTPDSDPRLAANQLTITNGEGGAVISNPFKINSGGLPRNTDGQVVYPYVAENEYCIEVRSETGNLLGRIPRMRSDALAASGGAGSPSVDAVCNNFAAALTTDFTGSNLIFIQSYAAGWENTAAGPVGGFYAYRTGTVGTQSSGHPGAFYDSVGSQFKPADFQRLYAEMFGAVTGVGNDSTTAIANMIATAVAAGKPCYLDGDEYRIYSQTNLTAAYTLLDYVAITITGDVEIYGNGNTVIKNNTTDNTQYMFFVENVDNFVMKGLTLNGNASANSKTGSIYLAGVLNAVLDIDVVDSAPVYVCASTTRQSDRVRFAGTIKNSLGFALSVNSGGAKKVDIGQLRLIDCDDGVFVSSKDIDGFSISLDAPQVTIDQIIGNVTNDMIQMRNGSLHFGAIIGTCNDVFGFALDTADVDAITGGTVRVTSTTGNIVNLTTTSGGKVTLLAIDYVYGRSLGNSLVIKSASQLVSRVHIGYIDVDGMIDLQDNTGNGFIEIEGGKVTDTTGITISSSGGQDLKLTNLDLSGCTTGISGAQYSSWFGEPALQAYAKNTTKTFAHGLKTPPKSVQFFIKCTTAEHSYSIGDVLFIDAFAAQVAGIDYGFSYKVDATNVTMQIANDGITIIQNTVARGTVVLTDGNWDIGVICRC
jgi:hypothetical protein